MSDLDQELRELLEAKARDGVVPPKPDPQVLKRARRRQAGTVLTALAGTAALVVASIVGVQALMRTDPITPSPADVPVLPDAAEGFRSVALPFASITYPDGWYLLETSPDHAPEAFQAFDVLQLTNWDPGLRTVRCDVIGTRIPDHGVMLQVALGNPDFEGPQWPVELRDAGGIEKGSCSETTRGAAWSAPSGIRYAASALTGSDASPADVEALERSFESLSFPPGSESQTEDFSGTPSLILDSRDTPIGPLALYAFLEPCEGTNRWIGIAGPSGSGLESSVGCGTDEVSIGSESVTMHLEAWGGVVWGEVAASAARAELRTVEGEAFPAELIPMPPSLGAEDVQIVWGIVERPTADSVTTVLYDEQGNVLTGSFPIGPRVTIAGGTDPEAGAWLLYLDKTSEGARLGFRFESGGGGSGCCLTPLEGDFRLAGWGTGDDDPANITALGSELLDRVVFEAISGVQIDGKVFPVPDESLGIPKVALVLVPHDVPVEGNLVAYDADGNEIGREFVGDLGEPPGPTPEIDAVWRNLRTARDAAAMYFDLHGSFAAVTPDALIDLAEERMTFATGPEPEVAHLFVTDDTHLVLSSFMVTGEAYCIAMEADPPNGGFGYRYGDVYAQSYDGCRGGWHELQP
jgi:hypothetical protein